MAGEVGEERAGHRLRVLVGDEVADAGQHLEAEGARDAVGGEAGRGGADGGIGVAPDSAR